MTHSAPEGTEAGKEILISFQVAGQGYCIDVMNVREIRGWTPATCLPSAPRHMHGMITLRGRVIPVLDLAVKLDHGASQATTRNAVIIVECGSQVVGLMVDAVSEIMTVNTGSIQPMPEVGSAGARHLVKGIIPNHGTGMLSWLALDSLVEDLAA